MNATSLLATLSTLCALAVGVSCTEAEREQTPDPPPEATAASTLPAAFDCPVTIPNASTPPGQRPFPTQHGNGDLWVVLPIDGKALVGPQQYAGPLGEGAAAKFGVFRADPNADIVIEGRRLDTAASPLEADIIEGYDGLIFQAASVRFPTLGCWEITVHGGDDILTVVMLLEES
ncbi:MAG: hypothetical protein R3C39_03890 [Dehalococcoidia bacterium]